GVGTMLPGDYDNDGNLDIGGTTTDANGVFLMLGNGAGSLAPPQILPAGTDPFGAAGADFDGDGNLDIVAFPGNSPHLRIFQGNGMGSLTAALTIPTSAAIRGVAADFDEDGDPDIVCVKAVGGNAGRVSLYSNEANPVVGGPSFNRGDANNDGAWNIADAIKILGFLFGGETIDCEVAGDANDDESLNVADAVYALTALFSSGPWFGAPTTCGEDPTPGTLSCDSFSTCP
ncbi:MAG: FG-GAP-like repeat-containing protein, partial [Planctomycetota bacterium]